MSDKSDIEDTDNALNEAASSDIAQIKEENDDIQQDDDFGSFDDAVVEDEDDDFGDFEEEEEFDIDNTPIFNTLQDAMDLWQHLLDQIYHFEALDSFTGNAPKSIKQYVLEEAPESLHSRLTWDSVTRYMENDTGIPRVKWHQSEIERHHLNALACQRSATPIMANTPPAMLNTEITQEPQPMMDMKPALDTVIGSNAVVDQPPITSSSSVTTTPTTLEKRSSVFGLSSLSRFLPHLSKSNLPKSPTSTTTSTAPTSPITDPKSLPRQQSATINHLNVSTLKQQQDTSIKRSNSVAFTSTRREATSSSSFSKQPHVTKPRPTSFQAAPAQCMDLFDLTEDPTTLVKSPTQIHFNLEPLVPTHALSPTPVRRNTIPANMHSDIQSTAPLDTIRDDEFGDFTAEVKQDLGQISDNDDFGDFSQEKKPAQLKPVNFIDEDPFSIMGGNNTMTGNNKPLYNNAKDDDDPYGIASYASHPSPPQPLPAAQQSNHLISLGHMDSFTTPQLPAIALSPKVMTPTTFDLLTPIASGLHSQPNTVLHLSDNASIWETTGSQQQPKADGKTVDNEDDDEWGDWAF